MNTFFPVVRPIINTMAAAVLTLATASGQSTQNVLPLPPASVSTIPSNGDVNPYGVAFAPKTVNLKGVLQPGDILVSNYNNSQNLQGLGTTILRVDKAGNTSTFFTAPSGQSGLSAAMGILSNGIVLIGNLPTVDGSAATVEPGRLALVNHNGSLFGTIGDPHTIDGPWGMTIYDTGNGVSGVGYVFVANVLSGTVSRFELTYTATSINTKAMILSSGFSHRVDPAALVLGPSGLTYDVVHDILYVCSSADNAIYQIPNARAATGTVSAMPFIDDLTHLHGPLDLSILPNGHFLVANSDGSNVDPNQPSELVEYSATGQFLAQMPIDANNGGAFGLATSNIGSGAFHLAAVDDNTSTLHMWTPVAQ